MSAHWPSWSVAPSEFDPRPVELVEQVGLARDSIGQSRITIDGREYVLTRIDYNGMEIRRIYEDAVHFGQRHRSAYIEPRWLDRLETFDLKDIRPLWGVVTHRPEWDRAVISV